MRPRLLLRLLLLVLPAFLAMPAWAGAAPLRLSVSVAPLTWLVQQLGGDQVQVQTLVRSGQDPHAYEPTPGQLTVLQGADAYLGMDLPFERAWLPRVRAANPDLRVVMLVDDHAASSLDPHLWVDPNNMVSMAGQVTELLVALRPGEAGFFAANRQRLVAQLMALDHGLASRFATLSRKTFLVHHPAWGHLAARYGLIQLAIEQEGKEPGPRALADLAAEVRRQGIDTLFVEPQASEHLAHGLADTLQLKIVPLDPLAADYPANMRRVADAIVAAAR